MENEQSDSKENILESEQAGNENQQYEADSTVKPAEDTGTRRTRYRRTVKKPNRCIPALENTITHQ